MALATALESYMLDLVNRSRAENGTGALRLETRLNASADSHSRWMLDADVFSHSGANGSTATQRIKAAGFDLSGRWGTAENLAYVSIDNDGSLRDEVQQLHANLMDSAGHRANLLNSASEVIGIGLQQGFFRQGGRDYKVLMVTQDFAYTDDVLRIDPASTAQSMSAAPGNTAPPGAAPPANRATPGDDVMHGGAGDDHHRGFAGDDRLFGGAGQDRLEGMSDNDFLFGGVGRDLLLGGNGDDRLIGGTGDDVLNGGDGKDVLNGLQGRDWAVYGNRSVTVDMRDPGQNRGDAAGDRLIGIEGIRAGNAADMLRGDGMANTFHGNGGDDVLNGRWGNDRLFGGAGDDTLTGGPGRDRMVGGTGHDRLETSGGYDTATGGTGADEFVFSGGSLHVTDFESGLDDVLLDAARLGLLGADAAQIAADALINADSAVLDFGNGRVVTLVGVIDRQSLEDDIILI